MSNTTAINGIGYPIFNVWNGITFKEMISLPLTMSKGLIETPEEKTIDYEDIDYTTSKVFKGWKIYFKLSYDEYTSKTTTKDIIKLLNYENAGHTLILTPRNDVAQRYFQVTGMNKNINIGVLKNGIGNRGLELNYVTTYLIATLDAIDLDDVRYIGQSLPQACGILQT